MNLSFASPNDSNLSQFMRLFNTPIFHVFWKGIFYTAEKFMRGEQSSAKKVVVKILQLQNGKMWKFRAAKGKL